MKAGMSLAVAAAQLDKSTTSLHRVETGQTLADVHLIRTMMDVYDQRDDTLIDLSREAKQKRPHSGLDEVDYGFDELEVDAGHELTFQLINIPGILQTENYMTAHFTGWCRPRDEQAVDEAVQIRMQRAERLTDQADRLHLHAVVDESALRRMVGGHGVMREQLRHLIAAAGLPTVTLQVIPANLGAHTSMAGGFILLSFPDPDEPDRIYAEHALGAVHTDKPTQVERAKLVFEHLCATALPAEESIRLIERVIAEL